MARPDGKAPSPGTEPKNSDNLLLHMQQKFVLAGSWVQFTKKHFGEIPPLGKRVKVRAK